MNLSTAFSDGREYLLRLKGPATIETSAGTRQVTVSGEAVLRVHGDHPASRGVSLTSFGLVAASVDAARGPTGAITVTGRAAGGIVRTDREAAHLRVEIEGDINYESLDRARVPRMESMHDYIPAREPAAGYLSGTLVEDEDTFALRGARVSIVCAAEEFGEVLAIDLARESMRLEPVLFTRKPRPRNPGQSYAGGGADSNGDANICILGTRRQLICQPVAFRSSAMDPSPSGGTAAAQFAEAQTVWAKACIDIAVRPTVYITDATLKTSSDLAAIRGSYTDADPNVIEVFFVANLLPAIGGGSAGAIGVASCKPVIAEPNAGNPVLLSHELGHVLGLQHPGAGSNSDAGTVMQPTGGANNPGTDTVTYFMCANIANPVLQTLPGMCCYTHDIGDHYIRDFPTDVGNEPSDPLPAGMTRYSMSNVWNRLSDTAGGWSATTGPEHQQPVRFNPDMTPFTNYLFAKVEQIRNLKVRNAVVKFYRKTPGSGGGGANLAFVGQVAVPDALAVGVPQTVRIPWTVPGGVPNHSCIFAVVRSDAEQEGDQSALDWAQFEALSHDDNDWAQRNLEIQDFDSGNTAGGEGNVVESAPFVIRIPPLDQNEVKLELEVDATAARGLASLALEVPGRARYDVRPGERVRIEPGAVSPSQDFVVVLQAVVPGGTAAGETFTANVEPAVNGRALVGFAAQFRAARPRAAVGAVLDVAAGAFTDLWELAGDPVGRALRARVRPLLADVPDPAGLAKEVAGWEEWEALEAAAGRHRALAPVGAAAAVAALRKQIEAFRAGDARPQDVVQAFGGVARRLSVGAALAGEGGGSTLASGGDVRVILDRVEIDYDLDLIGPGEFYFVSRVETGDGRVRERRIPERGHYTVDAGCRSASLQLDVPLFEGNAGAALKIHLEGREMDPFGMEDHLCTYERRLDGGADAIRGTYVPGDERRDPEKKLNWRVFYRVV